MQYSALPVEQEIVKLKLQIGILSVKLTHCVEQTATQY